MNVFELLVLGIIASVFITASFLAYGSIRARAKKSRHESRWDCVCPPEQCKPIDPIKMNNGKDGMMWGGNNYTIKTKR